VRASRVIHLIRVVNPIRVIRSDDDDRLLGLLMTQRPFDDRWL
jgi:hypothetical protein